MLLNEYLPRTRLINIANRERQGGRLVQQILCTMQIEGKGGGLPCLLAAATIQVGQTAVIWCYFKLLSPPKLSLCIYCHDKLSSRLWPSLHRNLRASVCLYIFFIYNKA